MARSGTGCWVAAAMGRPCRSRAISILWRIVRATKAASWSLPSALFSIIGTKLSFVRGGSPIFSRVGQQVYSGERLLAGSVFLTFSFVFLIFNAHYELCWNAGQIRVHNHHLRLNIKCVTLSRFKQNAKNEYGCTISTDCRLISHSLTNNSSLFGQSPFVLGWTIVTINRETAMIIIMSNRLQDGVLTA